MRFAILGCGAVGGYYGARLARAGHDVTFLARGAHLEAIRDRGLEIRSPLGDFVVKSPATGDPGKTDHADSGRCRGEQKGGPVIGPSNAAPSRRLSPVCRSTTLRR